MTALTSSDAPTTHSDENASGALSRRTVVAGAAWAVPAIVLASSTPAFATSGDRVASVTATDSRVAAAGASAIQASVESAYGAGVAGAVVSFTGPSGAVFTPSSATTDGSGVATSSIDLGTPWAMPGSTVAVNASSDTSTASAVFTVRGANGFLVGDGTSGKFGNGSTGDVLTSTQMPLMFPSPVVQVASGGNFSLALLQDGTVWSVGANAAGQLGDGTTADRATWAVVPSLSGVTQIGAGDQTGYALLNDQTVRSWGRNDVGQLGNGVAGNKTSPVAVSNLSGVVQLVASSSGGHALLSDKTARSWGYNGNGQLGDGTTTTTRTAVAVTGLSDIAQLAAGNGSGYALLNDGTVRSWGSNAYGQLGNGTTADSPSPVTVSGISGAIQIAASAGNGFALLSDGTMKSWGSGGYIGDGTTNGTQPTPTAVPSLTNLVQIGTGSSAAYALRNDGTVFSWGWNNHGQSGDGTTNNVFSPVQVSGVSDIACLAVNGPRSLSAFFLKAPATFNRVSTLTTPNMQALAAGSTSVSVKVVTPSGAPASGTTVSFSGPSGASFSPSSATTDSSGVATTAMDLGKPWTAPGSSVSVSAAVGTTRVTAALTVVGGNAYAVGDGQSGKLGNGGTADVLTAAQVALVFPSPVVAISSGGNFSLALLGDGSVWSAGANAQGQLGDGTTTDRSAWKKISTLSGVTQIAAGDQTGYALTSDQSVWVWGRNDVGQLGKGANGAELSPKRLTSLSGVTQIAAGRSSGYALMGDKTVRAWGYNGTGQLGDGTTTSRQAPVTVSSLSGVAQLNAYAGGCYALLTDGTVRAWGANDYGQLGNGPSTATSTVPVTVSGLSGVSKVTAAGYNGYALMNDATVQAWGANSEGYLGGGTFGGISRVPVAIPGLSGVTAVGAGSFGMYALMSDKTVRAWGWNNHGQAGSGDTTHLATPTTIANISDVTALMTNSSTSLSGFFIR